MHSDNGTNFIGAASELKDALDIYPPPFSPWMEGGWKSLIKSVKRAMKAITLDRVFTYEALYTFICETECIINQRLLTAISDDVNDFDTLTLNHCLIE